MTRGPTICPPTERLDAEVCERLDERVRHLAARLRGCGAGRAGLPEDVPVGKLVVLDRRGRVEEALLLGRLLGLRLGERDQRRGLRLADHVRELCGGVYERDRSGIGRRDQLRRVLDCAAHRAVEGAAGRGRSAPDDRSGRGAGEQEDAREDGQDADQCGSGTTECEPDEVAERAPDVAALAPEREQETEAEDEQSRAERTHIDQAAATDHQPADDHEHDGEHVRRAADQRLERVTDPPADVPAVPARPEHRRQEQAERDEAEPDQLRMLVPASGLALRALRLPHARGRARLEHALGGASPRHGQRFDALRRSPPAFDSDVSGARHRTWLRRPGLSDLRGRR